ncbi:MAG: hypothetical protein EBR82_62665 [Caulobacteraceae bacterium]|nr:hypothetical protein [Caulobacteraceae bacterium]
MDKKKKRVMKDFGAEGLGDRTGPLPGMPNPMEQAMMDKIAAAKAAAAAAPRPMPPAPPAGGGAPMPPAGGPGMKKGGKVKKMAKGGSTGSASKRADGCAQRGKTKGKFV